MSSRRSNKNLPSCTHDLLTYTTRRFFAEALCLRLNRSKPKGHAATGLVSVFKGSEVYGLDDVFCNSCVC